MKNGQRSIRAVAHLMRRLFVLLPVLSLKMNSGEWCVTAKQAWDILEMTHEGTSVVKISKLPTSHNQL